MKIVMKFESTEVKAVMNLVNRYAPNSVDCTSNYETKTKAFHMKNTVCDNGRVDIELDVKSEFFGDGVEFVSDIIDPIMSAAKHLKFLFKDAKNRFAKWAVDEWEVLAKHLAKDADHEGYVYYMTAYEEWVEKDPTHKVLRKGITGFKINDIEELNKIFISCKLNNKPIKYVRILKDGKYEITDQTFEAAQWLETDGKRVAE